MKKWGLLAGVLIAAIGSYATGQSCGGEESDKAPSTVAGSCKEQDTTACVNNVAPCSTKCSTTQDPFECPCGCWNDFKSCMEKAKCSLEDSVKKGQVKEIPGCFCQSDADCATAIKQYDSSGILQASCGQEKKICKLAGPSAPSDLKATAGDRQVTLEWKAVTGATGYEIYWGNEPGLKKGYLYSGKAGGNKVSASAIQIPAGTVTYTHTGSESPTFAGELKNIYCPSACLENGTTYYYMVTAVTAFGESAESNEVSAIPTAGR